MEKISYVSLAIAIVALLAALWSVWAIIFAAPPAENANVPPINDAKIADLQQEVSALSSIVDGLPGLEESFFIEHESLLANGACCRVDATECEQCSGAEEENPAGRTFIGLIGHVFPHSEYEDEDQIEHGCFVDYKDIYSNPAGEGHATFRFDGIGCLPRGCAKVTVIPCEGKYR